MKEKKNIERLFQEKFKHFEAPPPAAAWENINKKLSPEKPSKKALPLWLKLSGIAAVFLVGFVVLKTNFSESQIEFSNKETPEEIYLENRMKQNEETIKYESESLTKNNKVENTNTIESFPSTVEEKKLDKQDQALTIVENNSPTPKKEESIITTNKKSTQNNGLVNSSDLTQKSKTNKKDSENQNTQPTDNLVIHTTELKKTSDLNSDKEMSEDKIEKNTSVKRETKMAVNQKTKTTTQNEEIIPTEDNQLVQSETNPLQEMMEKKDSEDESHNIENLQNKWRVTPTIAPITMNSLTGGSSVSESFIDNSKDNQTTLSYGLGFSYAFNKKLNIRTGINKVAIGYITNDVEIYAATDTKDILSNPVNISFNNSSTNIIIKPEDAFSTQNISSANTGKINQQIGYIEVPVELSFKIIDSRFGIELIGGMSTLFLNENEISVISQGMSTVLGEADNLNDVHFSTNLGVGFKYEIFKSFEASLEPMFKYQLGTFSKNDGNFKPYILGLYTGLSFKF